MLTKCSPFLLWLTFSAQLLHAAPQDSPISENPGLAAQKPETKAKPNAEKQQKKSKLIPFSFTDRELTDIINFLAAQKEVNIVLPQGANAIKPEQKVTFKPTDRDMLTLKEAWSLLKTFLELSGYGISFQNNAYVIFKNDEKSLKEILPIYINVAVKELPQSEQRIKYLYYFVNLKVSDETTQNALKQILDEMLSSPKGYLFEPKANALIITDKASNIASVMRIINELDISGFKEVVQVVPLYYASAGDVDEIFKKLRQATPQGASPFISGSPKAESSTYFPSGTVLVPDPRTNSLIVMGRETAVNRIYDFISEYIDVAPESGKSILHYYDLQYLDAKATAELLNKIIKRETQADQSKGSGATAAEKFFSGVIVVAETLQEIKPVEGQLKVKDALESIGSKLTTGSEMAKLEETTTYAGGNRLVVAALHEDWIHIKALIDQIDKPQPQVILEVYIVDFANNDERALGSSNRNLLDCRIDNGLDYLVSMLSAPSVILPPSIITNGTPPTTNTIVQDLMQNFTDSSATPAITDITSVLAPGSCIISINDPCTGVAGIIQLLQTRMAAKILHTPYVVTLNNAKAYTELVTIRRASGETFSSGTNPITPIVDITAAVRVEVLPRISSMDRLALEIAVSIDQFTSVPGIPDNENNKNTRRIITNANLSSGQVLVLGGLTQKSVTDTEYDTPLLSKIPLIGWLFKKLDRLDVVNNLAVFIAPTIVEPKLRGGLYAYTKDKLRTTKKDISDDVLFSNFRDPITRFFFRGENTTESLIRDYVSQSTNAPDMEDYKIRRNRSRSKTAKMQSRRPIAEPQTKEENLKETLALKSNPLSRHKSQSKHILNS